MVKQSKVSGFFAAVIALSALAMASEAVGAPRSGQASLFQFQYGLPGRQ